MGDNIKRLGDAELEIMQVLWGATESVTSKLILDSLKGRRNWALSSLMSTLARLVEKGFVECDRSTRTNYYTALIPEDTYRAKESKTFLEKLYGNSFQSLVTSLYSSEIIDDADLDELRQFLDDPERGRIKK